MSLCLFVCLLACFSLGFVCSVLFYCVCVCVREREREREGGGGRQCQSVRQSGSLSDRQNNDRSRS